MKKGKIAFLATAAVLFAAMLILLTVGIAVVGSPSGYRSGSIDASKAKSAVLTQEGGQTIVAESREDSGVITAFSREGEAQWSYRLPDYYSMLHSVGGAIFAGAGRSILVIDGQGTLKDSFQLPYVPSVMDGRGNKIAVVSSISTTKNVISVYSIGEDLSVSCDFEMDSNRSVPQITVLKDGTVLFGTGSAVYECVAGFEGEYTARKLFDSETTFEGMYAEEAGCVYLSTMNGTLERYERGEDGYSVKCSVPVGSGGGAIASDGKGKIAVIDYTGSVLLYDTTAEKPVASFRSHSSANKLSLSSDGTLLVFKAGKTLEFFDAEKLGSFSFFQKFQPYSITLTALTAVVLAAAILFLTEKGEKKLREIGCKLNKSKRSYFYLLPTFALLLVFNYYPIVWGFSLAFQDYMPGIRADFVGFQNFVTVLKDAQFWSGAGNMIIFLVTDLFKAILPPFLVAEVIHSINSKKTQYAARFIMFLPGILPGVAATLLWQDGIFGTEGAISQLFGALGVEELARFDWLGDERTAKWALVFFGFPWVGQYLIYYGALRAVPDSIYEAAELDGFSWAERLVRIDIPMISAQIKYIFVTTFISSVQNFSRVFITTNGAFDTNIPALELYKNITTHQNYGVASAMGIILFLLIFGATLYNLRARKSESY